MPIEGTCLTWDTKEFSYLLEFFFFFYHLLLFFQLLAFQYNLKTLNLPLSPFPSNNNSLRMNVTGMVFPYYQ